MTFAAGTLLKLLEIILPVPPLIDKLFPSALSVTSPKKTELPERYKSFQRLVLLPRLYVTLLFGIKFETTAVANKLPTLAFPATDNVVSVPTLVILG